MLVSAALLTLFWLQAPVAHPHTRHAGAHAEARAPRTPQTVQTQLDAGLHAPVFAGDELSSHIEGHSIVLSGVVHQAEHKGLATRAARHAAHAGGWNDYRVKNEIRVELGRR